MMTAEKIENGMKSYMVTVYNALDGGFGYDCGETVYIDHLDEPTAKSIARHKNKTSPDFMSYIVREAYYDIYDDDGNNYGVTDTYEEAQEYCRAQGMVGRISRRA